MTLEGILKDPRSVLELRTLAAQASLFDDAADLSCPGKPIFPEILLASKKARDMLDAFVRDMAGFDRSDNIQMDGSSVVFSVLGYGVCEGAAMPHILAAPVLPDGRDGSHREKISFEHLPRLRKV